MFIGIDHTAIASRNALQLANWYVEHLEFQIAAENQGKYFIRAENGTLLEIIPGEGESIAPDMTALGVRHVAILVNDLETARNQLCRSNIEFITDAIYIQELDLRVIFFRDLDGNILHLIQRGMNVTAKRR